MNLAANLLPLLCWSCGKTFLQARYGALPSLHSEADGLLSHRPDHLNDLRVRHEGDQHPVDADQDVPHLQSPPGGGAHQAVDLN